MPTVTTLELSPQQKHLWAAQQGQTQVYRSQCMLLLEGCIQEDLLKEAVGLAVQSHESLRTTFHGRAGTLPELIVTDRLAPAWREHDFTGLESSDQAAKVEALFQDIQQEPFDLAEGPLLSVALVKLSPNRQLLLTAMPALCADVVTLENFMRAIGRFYAARLQGSAAAEPSVQYADVAVVLNQLLHSEETEAGVAFWQNWNTPQVKLPYEKDGLGRPEFKPLTREIPIDPALVAQLEALAQVNDTSVEVLLLTSWRVLLARLTGEPDTLVAAAYQGRTYAGLAEAFGPFARYLPLRCALEGTLTITQALKRMSDTYNEAGEWQDYFSLEGYEGLMSAGAPPTLLPYQFDFLTYPASYPAAGVTFSMERLYTCADRFKIKLLGIQKKKALSVEFHYDSALFSDTQLQRLGEQFITLLASATRSPHTTLSDLEIIGPVEQYQLLIEVNRTEFEFPQTHSIPQLFEAQVQRTPNNPAVIFQDEQLSYAELNAQANRLAHYLQSLGVQPESRVGLDTTRSLNLLVGVLGILKAGGAYVPLDPLSPPDRLAYLIADTQLSVIVTQSELSLNLPKTNGGLINLDSDQETLSRFPTTNPAIRVTPQNLAYVLYTSGSTGKPKGVMIQHRSVVNLATALHQAIYQKHGPALRVSLNAPLIFDGSVKQWVQLLYGHCIDIVPDDVRTNAAKFLDFAERHALKVIDCTPSLLKLLLVAGFAKRIAPAVVLVGGEAIDQATWVDLAQNSRTDFVNVYGPTETTVDATVCSARLAPERPVIGRPIANIRVYVLDHNAKPVPLGVPGEIHVGGAGLARGYLNQPALTAARFIPDPFSGEPGARLYKTGDLGCWQEDGQLAFLGRRDHQVQLHGIRVELGEIESVLRDHPAIHDSVVVVRETNLAVEHLVVYIVPHPATENRPAEPHGLVNELRQLLREKLPEYMVPKLFVPLTHLPLSRSGKVNRHALPEPDLNGLASSVAYTSPSNDIERTIVAIWQEALGVEKIGVHDNFFDLGGHSLLLAQVTDKLSAAFNKKFPLVEMYRHSTVSALTQYLHATPAEPAPSPTVQGRVHKQREALQHQRQLMLRGKKNL